VIDLHSHILPGIDDGATSLEMSLEMARMFAADGVTTVACTPHILPGVFHNTGPHIKELTAWLQQHLDHQGIPLRVVPGCDGHIVPDFVPQLQKGHLLPLGESRYVLVEPPHNKAPPKIAELFFNILTAGYVPILTHPERLAWIASSYHIIEELFEAGVWMQLTASSVAGDFGKTPKYWSDRMLDEGRVHILATDAHNVEHRPPNLSRGRNAAARRIGEEAAHHLVVTRPAGVLSNVSPAALPLPSGRLADVADASETDHDGTTGDTARTTRLQSGRPRDTGGFAGRLRRLFE
jgi:protein-tyrosine phosphatase